MIRMTAFRGSAHPLALILGGSLIAAGILIALLRVLSAPPPPPVEKTKDGQQAAAQGGPLLVFCAAGVRPPVEAVAKRYREEYGIEIQLQYDTSEALQAKLSLAKTGDLYIPADISYLQKTRANGQTCEQIPLATLTPVLAFKKGNPKGIKDLASLLQADTRVVLASPSAAIRKTTEKVLKKTNQWQELETRRLAGNGGVSEVGTVTEVANALKIGAADAGLLWDAVAEQYPDLEVLRLPELDAAKQQTELAVLSTAANPTLALHFARYLAASDRGLPEFTSRGYKIAEGDEWAERPKLTIFLGSMLRPAIEETIKAFAKREGVDVTTGIDGCGILVGQMRAGARPDMYFACDVQFMNDVKILFGKPEEISENTMVIAVAKGNPKNIKELKDLTRPGIKVGIGHEQQCALGWLTKGVLDQTNFCDEIMKNVALRSTTGDTLVNQMQTGALDAAIVYETNTHFARGKIDVVKVRLDQKFAVQPVAVGLKSKHKHLTGRLVALLKSQESEQRFKELGFVWKAEKE